MRISFGLTAAILLACRMTATAAPRAFTESTTGRVINAEIQSATDDHVTLKLENGTEANVPLSRLSKADQDFVQSWAKTQPPTQAPSSGIPQKLNFKVEWNAARIGNKLRPTDEIDPKIMAQTYAGLTREEISEAGSRTLYENWLCHFKITNLNRTPLTNLQVHYELLLNQKDDNKKSRTRMKEGNLTIPLIDALKSASADTPPFRCWGSKKTEYFVRQGSQGQAVTTSGNTHLFLEEVEGVIITLKNNDETIYQFESPEIKNLRKPK